MGNGMLLGNGMALGNEMTIHNGLKFSLYSEFPEHCRALLQIINILSLYTKKYRSVRGSLEFLRQLRAPASAAGTAAAAAAVAQQHSLTLNSQLVE